MLPAPIRLFNPTGPQRVAVVSAAPGADADTAVLHVARGTSHRKLGKPSPFGPYPLKELDARRAKLLADLELEGYLPSGLHALLGELADASALVRARAAMKLGWRRETRAVEPLLNLLPKAVDDTCAVLDALGAIGDARALPALRDYSSRKLLSRRRSAVEALRMMGDAEGLNLARQHLLDQLPPPVRAAITMSDSDAGKLVEAVQSLDIQFHGLAADALYELATPASLAATRTLIEKFDFSRPYIWRYVKSVFKRAMLRHDHAAFGWLAHAIERRGRSNPGSLATVKSGYDGAQRHMRIFGRATVNYLRGLSWRWLRTLAEYRPDEYPFAAAEAVIWYSDDDASEPQGRAGRFANCYVLNKVVYAGGNRLVLHARDWRHTFRNAAAVAVPANVREEMYPELWDSRPRAYLRVLGAAKLPEVHAFAVRAIEHHHRNVLEAASLDEVLALLDATYEPTLRLGLTELERRFDPARPDWNLILRLVGDTRKPARELGLKWLPLAPTLWHADAARMLALLTVADADTRLAVARLVIAHVQPSARPALADGVLAILRTPEPSPGFHDAAGLVAQEAVRDELAARFSVADLMEALTHGSKAVQSVAGALLGAKPEAVAELGLERITGLAQHELASVRNAARTLLRSATAALQKDPSPLFALIDSDWADTHEFALEQLRNAIDLRPFGVDGFVGLIDSNRPDVQDHGRDLILRHLDELPILDLLERLIQHPHPNVHAFALELVVKHLPEDAHALADAIPFARRILFDLWPSRAMKRKVLDFLTERGQHDADHATVAAGLLSEIVRVQGRTDFERALAGLVRIRLAFPNVDSAVRLQMPTAVP